MTTDPDAYDSSDPRRPLRPIPPNFLELSPVRDRDGAIVGCTKCLRPFAPGDIGYVVEKNGTWSDHLCSACADLLHRVPPDRVPVFERGRSLAVFALIGLATGILASLALRAALGPRQVDVRYPPRFLAGDATPGWHRLRALVGRDAVIEVDGRVGLVSVADRPELRAQAAQLLALDEAEVLVVDDPFDELRAILARQAP